MKIKKDILIAAICFYFVGIFSVSAIGWDIRDIDQIVTDPKSINVTSNTLRIKGAWEKIDGSPTVNVNKPPKVNTVLVTCTKNSLICREIIAGIVTPKDHQMLNGTTFLDIEETKYKIYQWSNEVIIARNMEERVSDFELKIECKTNTVERYRRETNARGCTACDPSVFERWLLK